MRFLQAMTRKVFGALAGCVTILVIVLFALAVVNPAIGAPNPVESYAWDISTSWILVCIFSGLGAAYLLARVPPLNTKTDKIRWERKGSEDGQHGEPKVNQKGLSPAETQIKDEYDTKMEECRKNYRNQIDMLDERIDRSLLVNFTTSEALVPVDRAPGQDDDTDSDIEIKRACTTLDSLIRAKESELEGMQREAQDAIDDLKRFRTAQNLARSPDIPESLTFSWGLLLVVVLIETLVNGVFFGEHVAGSVFQGITIALLASVINVLILGVLIASLWRQKNHKDDSRKVLSLTFLAILITLSLLVNVFVAHYRDALPPDEPAVGHECRLGDNEDIASAEALCLLVNEWFSLGGFMSYMLLIIGLGACGFGAWEFYRMDDHYPGYGKLERKRVRMVGYMRLGEQEALAHLRNEWSSIHDRLLNAFNDPVKNWERSEGAIREQSKRHEDFKEDIAALEKRCSGNIEVYRAANRNARKDDQPCPPHWDEPWVAGWTLPDLSPRHLCSRSEAEARQVMAKRKLERQLAEINSCFKKCERTITTMTRLRHA